ncbi:NAD(P)-dependent dehydrogenase, short-chain alcohol dehydrogenase family [Faunimonas pinastri]|uniref:NAD(P)-dependent dehydrogenase, short-chain alcohol dehydrogenase family n=1 Tax=Faunimonas pinastri TaxID=1855383 RepID=A0A1H8ZCL6_9HYPH|nr:glucose 1-dehydrogenase [Faunimonas pinastri]SEP62132.1 NAD(P)-dependent dehydrogenase, short-chain alcohol dehydrogenase family [Faunimonas pinastri]
MPVPDYAPVSFSLDGQVAVVTGASRGIGQALAIALAGAGADVALLGRDEAALGETAEAVRKTGRAAFVRHVDVADVASIEAAFAAVAGEFGRVDILVNNAGTEEVRPSLDVDEALWDRLLDTNLKGAFFCAQAAAKLMTGENRSGGRILNLCSLTSKVGIPTATPYGASKTGLVGMTRALAAEWAPLGIRVNGIGPGYFRTALTEGFYENADWQTAMLGKIPLGRFGAMEDLMGAAVFLCSPAASYITGQVLYVDGGTLASI